MPTKISLSAKKTSFKLPVLIPVPGAKPEPLEFTCNYLTKPDFNKLLDEHSGARIEVDDYISDGRINNQRLSADIDAASADDVLKIATGWELSEELNKENLLQLEAVHPGSLRSIMVAYRAELLGERIKN